LDYIEVIDNLVFKIFIVTRGLTGNTTPNKLQNRFLPYISLQYFKKIIYISNYIFKTSIYNIILSIDKILQKDSNNSFNLYLQYLNINRDMFLSNMNNMKLMWDEFWRIWNEDQKKNPYYNNPYLYYYDIFIRSMNKKSD
jgi:hypothetical protein